MSFLRQPIALVTSGSSRCSSRGTSQILSRPIWAGYFPESRCLPGPGAGPLSWCCSCCSAPASGITLAHFVRRFVDFQCHGSTFLGFVFGLFRGLVMLGVFVILAQTLRLDGDPLVKKRQSGAHALRGVASRMACAYG